MILYLAGLAIGFLIALAGRCRPRDLAALQIRAPGVPIVAAALELGTVRAVHALGIEGAAVAPALLLAVVGLGVVTVITNWGYAGMWFIGAGLAANGLVMAANQGRMPVSAAAVAALGVDPAVALAEVAAGLHPVHRLLDQATALPWLADILPIAPASAIISLGDVLIIAGLGMVVTQAMRAGRRRRLAVLRRGARLSADDPY